MTSGFGYPHFAPIGLSRLAPNRRFGLVLGLLRRSRGLSQSRLGEKLGYSVSGQKQVCLWELGQVKPAPATIDAIGEALALLPEDLWYLKGLAGYVPTQPAPSPEEEARAIELGLAEVSKYAVPAHLMDAHWNVRAWNAAAAEVLHLERSRHILDVIFNTPTDWASSPNWETMAHEHITVFRQEMSARRHEEWYMQTVDLLSGLPRFVELWNAPPAPLDPLGHNIVVLVEHHRLGPLAFNVTGHLAFGAHSPFWLIVFEPKDEDTASVFA